MNIYKAYVWNYYFSDDGYFIAIIKAYTEGMAKSIFIDSLPKSSLEEIDINDIEITLLDGEPNTILSKNFEESWYRD